MKNTRPLSKARREARRIEKFGNADPICLYCGRSEPMLLRPVTRTLLQRTQILPGRLRYIGKETSRRWEQGEDLSMVDFRCTEYSDGKVTADEETRRRIREIGIREIARQAGIDRETVGLIANGHRVKAKTLAKVFEFVSSVSV